MRELLGIIILLILIWVHYTNAREEKLKSFYFYVLALKLLAGLGVGLVYKYHYGGGDTWNYFQQAELFGSTAFANWSNFKNLFFMSNYELLDGFVYFNQPRAALMVKLVAAINLITGNNYWLTSSYFSFFSFIGIWAFAAWVRRSFFYGNSASAALFIWPSFVFWSSGILKESIAVGLIFWIVAGFMEMIDSRLFKKGMSLLAAFLFLFFIKYYFAVVLLVILIVYGIVELTPLKDKKVSQQFAAWLLILSIGMLAGGYLHPNLEPMNFLNVVNSNYKAFVTVSSESSLIQFIEIPVLWKWFLVNSPLALFAGLFMPIFFSKESLFYSIVVIENGLLIILFLRGVYMIKINELRLNANLLFASVFYVSMLAVFLSLSTPNLGTLSRYKVAYIPFFLVLMMLANKVKLPKAELN